MSKKKKSPVVLDKQKIYLSQVLKAMLGREELVNKWWTSPNRAFDLRTPEDMYRTYPKRVSEYILGYAFGR
jgi:hypothetical protein